MRRGGGPGSRPHTLYSRVDAQTRGRRKRDITHAGRVHAANMGAHTQTPREVATSWRVERYLKTEGKGVHIGGHARRRELNE